MTGDGDESAGDGDPATAGSGRENAAGATRRATVRSTHVDAATAGRVAASVRPDNTAAMDTRVEGETVVTTVARDSTGGLQSTVDDYVVNVTVAAQCTTDPDAAPDAGGESSTHET